MNRLLGQSICSIWVSAGSKTLFILPRKISQNNCSLHRNSSRLKSAIGYGVKRCVYLLTEKLTSTSQRGSEVSLDYKDHPVVITAAHLYF